MVSSPRLLLWSAAIAAAVLSAAAAALIWSPWHASTPGPPLATALPTGCPDLLGVPGPKIGGRQTGPNNLPEYGCEWGPGIPGWTSPVVATTALYPTIAAARQASLAQVTVFNGPTHGFSAGADTPIGGVGDDARITDHDGYLVLVARKANVVLTMDYTAPHPEYSQDNQAVLATAARAILSGVKLNTA